MDRIMSNWHFEHQRTAFKQPEKQLREGEDAFSLMQTACDLLLLVIDSTYNVQAHLLTFIFFSLKIKTADVNTVARQS